MINVGAVLALTGVVFLQQAQGFFTGYLLPAVALLLSFLSFLVGKSNTELCAGTVRWNCALELCAGTVRWL